MYARGTKTMITLCMPGTKTMIRLCMPLVCQRYKNNDYTMSARYKSNDYTIYAPYLPWLIATYYSDFLNIIYDRIFKIKSSNLLAHVQKQ